MYQFYSLNEIKDSVLKKTKELKFEINECYKHLLNTKYCTKNRGKELSQISMTRVGMSEEQALFKAFVDAFALLRLSFTVPITTWIEHLENESVDHIVKFSYEKLMEIEKEVIRNYICSSNSIILFFFSFPSWRQLLEMIENCR